MQIVDTTIQNKLQEITTFVVNRTKNYKTTKHNKYKIKMVKQQKHHKNDANNKT